MTKARTLLQAQKTSVALALIALCALAAQGADTAYVTTYSGSPSSLTTCPPYCFNPLGLSGILYSSFGSTAISSPPGAPSRSKCTYGYGGPVNWSIQPTLTVAGAVYTIEEAHATNISSASSNVLVTAFSSDGVVSASCTNSTIFRRANGGDVWRLMGYITNNTGVTQPTITFVYTGGQLDNSNAPGNRLYIDAFRFVEVTGCAGAVGTVDATGPLAEGQTSVNVSGVTAGATNVTILSNGSSIGSTNYAPGFAAGTLTVPTSALIKDRLITVTQLKTGCISTAGTGLPVGGGANPKIRVVLGLLQNSALTGPAGANTTGAGSAYWLKATGLTQGSSSAPLGGQELIPDQCWQTVTFDWDADQGLNFITGGTLTDNNPYAALDSLVFAIDDTDSGPYDIYVDEIKNGSTTIEDFEGYNNGTANVTFVSPNTPTTPSASATYMTAPNSSGISQAHVFSGTNACRIQWQFKDASNVRWARVLASSSTGKKYPQLDTTKKVTIRYLVLPVGVTVDHKFNGTPGNITGASPAYATGSNTLAVSVSGGGSYTYQWSFNDNTVGGATSSSLVIGGVSGLDSNVDNGTYSVAINDGFCTETKSVSVSVIDPIPSVTNQPTAKTIAHVGDNVGWTVGGDGHAGGGYPLTYQWRFNGSDITDATTSSFTTNNVQVANAGSYTVVVGNTYGSVTSSVAILDVVQPGVIVGTGTGLRGDYWASHAFTNGLVSSSPFLGAPTLTRTDATVNFSFGTGGPGSGVGSDLFTVRWSGQVQALDADTYTFITTTDDGVRLWVNGQSIVDHWALQAPTDRSGTIALTANTKYNILMEYFENGSGATAQLSWSTAGGGVPREIIPKSQLYPATGAAHPTLTGTVDNGTNIVFSWGPGTYNLQSSTVVTGVYTTVTGGIVSPFTITIDPAAPQQFYRLQVQ